MSRIAPRMVYGIDSVGVRRRYPVGSVIPDAVRLEEEIPQTRTAPAEAQLLGARKADRRGIVKPAAAAKGKSKPKARTRKQR